MRTNRRPSAPAAIAAVLLAVLFQAADLSAQGVRRNEPPRPDFIPADYDDYQHTLTRLGITQMRRGRDGRGPDTSDEAISRRSSSGPGATSRNLPNNSVRRP